MITATKPKKQFKIDGGEAVGFLRKMMLIREFEERALRLFTEGELVGMCHVSVGQEAVAVGVCSQLRKDDYVASTHRGHGHCIAKGADVGRMFARALMPRGRLLQGQRRFHAHGRRGTGIYRLQWDCRGGHTDRGGRRTVY